LQVESLAPVSPEYPLRRLDSYILRQTVGPFLFFVLVFTGVIWLTQSLRVVETVVNNGQSARVFLEFTALLLPMVLSIVLPVSLFAAVLYTINRLFGDSEIVVMMAAGLSATAILRAVTMFGVAVMAIVYLMTLYLMPLAQREMRELVTQIRGDVAVAFMREGAFLTPVEGVTVYLRETGASGEMLGVFVHDGRDPEHEVTYSARRALLVRDGAGTRLLMFDGLAQSIAGPTPADLSVLRFDQIAYDLAALEPSGAQRVRKPSEMFVPELLTIEAERAAPRPLGEFRAEAHEALSGPLYTLALPLLAVAFVVGAGFRRQGFTGRIVMAAGAGLGVRLAGLAAKSVVTGAAPLWPLMYVPPLLAIAFSLWLLSGVRLLPRRRAGAA
jgi:lipopolysaccharide export system permease protein